jgi:hypothetical protein
MRPSETDRLYLEEITASRYPVAMDDQPPLRIDITGVGQPTAPEEVGPAPDDLTAIATQMSAGTEPAGATPMTMGEFGIAVADTIAGIGKGGLQGSIGLPGDIISLARGLYDLGASGGDLDAFLAGLEKPTGLPTTEDMKKFFDETLGIPLVPAGASERRREAAKIPEFVGELGGGGKTVIEGTKAVGRGARELKSTIDKRSSFYDIEQSGPFLNISNKPTRRGQEVVGPARVYRGTVIDARDTGQRSAIYGNEAGQTDQELQLRLEPNNNTALRIAQTISAKYAGSDYKPDFKIEPSSLRKQSAIGISYGLAASKAEKYKQRVFNAYQQDAEYGPIIKNLGIKNYDDLVRASYKQLEKETIDQFRSLPVSMSFHKAGEGNYFDSAEMVKDVHLHNHLFVFQGGEPHEFLGKIDPQTGLSSNDMFRAVHDYFGHAIKGNSFGPKGEEIAWASHSQMYSPLARIAMTSETRGQNSFVNYTPINAELVKTMENLRKSEIDLRSRNNIEAAEQVKEQIRKLGSQWQYAEQASIALPPEMTKIDYSGGMPEYIRTLQQPIGEQMSAEHYSRVPSIEQTDPSKVGSAAIGREKTRLSFPGAVKGRTNFYIEGAEPEAVVRSIAPYKYKAQLSGLYDADKDPLKIKKLANVKNTESYLSKVNQGAFDPDSAANDFERLVYENGYKGFVTGEGKNRVAVTFEPVKVERQ